MYIYLHTYTDLCPLSPRYLASTFSYIYIYIQIYIYRYIRTQMYRVNPIYRVNLRDRG